jgi:hypothetical protein
MRGVIHAGKALVDFDAERRTFSTRRPRRAMIFACRAKTGAMSRVKTMRPSCTPADAFWTTDELH